jgi:hypothetical protein
MKRNVEVTFLVEVEIDETKLTPEFMEHFRQYFYDFESVDEHIEHLAQLEARNLIGDTPDSVIEGYGKKSQWSLKTRVVDGNQEMQTP